MHFFEAPSGIGHRQGRPWPIHHRSGSAGHGLKTFVNYRPKELWPKRVLKFDDATRQLRMVLRTLEEQKGFMTNRAPTRRGPGQSGCRLASQKTIERFDEIMRDLALRRYRDFEVELSPTLVRFAVTDVTPPAAALSKLAICIGRKRRFAQEGRRDALVDQLARRISARGLRSVLPWKT